MTDMFERLMTANKADVQELEGWVTRATVKLEKLIHLNLAAGKTVLGESFGRSQAFLAAKDANELMALQAGMFQALTVNSIDYFNRLFSIEKRTVADLAKDFKVELAEAQTVFSDVVENVIESAPAGTEGTFADFKNDAKALRNLIE